MDTFSTHIFIKSRYSHQAKILLSTPASLSIKQKMRNAAIMFFRNEILSTHVGTALLSLSLQKEVQGICPNGCFERRANSIKTNISTTQIFTL